MYLRCDGTLSVDTDNKPVCDNWVAVSDTELLGAVVQQYQMSQADYLELSGFILLIFAVAYGIRSTIQTAKHDPYSGE